MTARVDRYWADFFGIDVACLSAPGVHVGPHAALEDYAGVWLFRRAAACIVSAPASRVAELAPLLSDRSPAELGRRDAVEALFPEAAAVIGPAFHASVSPACFQRRPDPDVRPLGPSDADAVASLRAACSAEDWEAGGLDGAARGFGCFRDGRLAALACRRAVGTDACDPCVVTHPEFRGTGCGAAAVSAVVEEAIADDQLVLYQTLVANGPAVALAQGLGFDPCGTHLAVRLPDPD